MLDDFFTRALLGGLGAALVAGPLGCFVVWRRMAYFGDALSHSALFGIALGLLLGFDPILGVALSGIILALGLYAASRGQRLASDTALGLMAHGSLALGLVLLSFLESLRVDLLGYLFGDLLAVSRYELLLIWAGGAVVLLGLALLWRPLLRVTIAPELAAAEGVPVALVELAFLFLLALLVATAMTITGILLITALLILPAAAARRLSRTPEFMAAMAAGLGVVAVFGGLYGSLFWDTPSGPSIVVALLALFLLLQLVPLRIVDRKEGGE